MEYLEAATPLEIAALRRLGLLSGDDVARICMRWLEEDLDGGDPDVAVLAGRRDLLTNEEEKAFGRRLDILIGRPVEREEALLLALRLHLAASLRGDLTDGVALLLERFGERSDCRLVHHPRRVVAGSRDVYAKENLGLEYVYGVYCALVDIPRRDIAGREAATAALREEVLNLHAHLTTVLTSDALRFA